MWPWLLGATVQAPTSTKLPCSHSAQPPHFPSMQAESMQCLRSSRYKKDITATTRSIPVYLFQNQWVSEPVWYCATACHWYFGCSHSLTISFWQKGHACLVLVSSTECQNSVLHGFVSSCRKYISWQTNNVLTCASKEICGKRICTTPMEYQKIWTWLLCDMANNVLVIGVAKHTSISRHLGCLPKADRTINSFSNLDIAWQHVCLIISKCFICTCVLECGDSVYVEMHFLLTQSSRTSFLFVQKQKSLK